MTDQVIRAALEAALEKNITDAWTLEDEHRQWALEQTAATIVAFLRAMNMDHAAAAVEAAAREAGDA